MPAAAIGEGQEAIIVGLINTSRQRAVLGTTVEIDLGFGGGCGNGVLILAILGIRTPMLVWAEERLGHLDEPGAGSVIGIALVGVALHRQQQSGLGDAFADPRLPCSERRLLAVMPMALGIGFPARLE